MFCAVNKNAAGLPKLFILGFYISIWGQAWKLWIF